MYNFFFFLVVSISLSKINKILFTILLEEERKLKHVLAGIPFISREINVIWVL